MEQRRALLYSRELLKTRVATLVALFRRLCILRITLLALDDAVCRSLADDSSLRCSRGRHGSAGAVVGDIIPHRLGFWLLCFDFSHIRRYRILSSCG